ncbi:MAG: hypothetical protein PF503_06320 [Desulfobacula sp.]|nr:hypothetical protein [Desulfobacula sp.]
MAVDQDNAHDTQLLAQIQRILHETVEEKSAKQELAEQTRQTLTQTKKCLTDINIQLAKMKADQSSFHLAWRDRLASCDTKHQDFESRLRKVTTKEECIAHGQQCILNEKKIDVRLKTVEIKVDGFTPLLYKLIGGVIVIAVVVPPMVSALIGFVITHIFTKPVGS